MTETSLDNARIWLEFPDPDSGEVPDQVFRCDLTWLLSQWTCIFGQGCHGIMADRPHDGCCTLGAHFADEDDESRVERWVRELTPQTWERHPDNTGDTESWVYTDADGDRCTRVVDGACIMLNSPTFPGGSGCALHHSATRAGVSHVQTKPDVCWQLPIRRTYRDVTRPDGSEYLEVTIAEYDRRGWGEGGLDLDWYCTGAPVAHVGQVAVYQSMADELIELMGEPAYRELARRCDQARPARTLLPLLIHPATSAASAPTVGGHS